VRDCAVPGDDRFPVFTVHASQTLIYDESFMAMHRSDGIALVQVTSNPPNYRTERRRLSPCSAAVGGIGRSES
jgi:hypothetical protein